MQPNSEADLSQKLSLRIDGCKSGPCLTLPELESWFVLLGANRATFWEGIIDIQMFDELNPFLAAETI